MVDLRPKYPKNDPSLFKKKGIAEKKIREDEKSDLIFSNFL